MKKISEEIENTTFTATSGGGMVTATMTGDRVLKSVELKPEVVDPDDKEMLEDMIKLAINEAIERIDEENEKIQAKLTSGMRMPF